jgi:acetyltransferase-like isoleucine patch superfamily enzyme
MNVRFILKRIAQGLALIIVLLPSLLCAFGRAATVFTFFAQLLALVPGILGSFGRAAFYKLTVEECSIDSTISFGSYFSCRHVVIEPYVSIGSYCIIGLAQIGTRTQISSNVQIAAARLHTRDNRGRISDSPEAQQTYVKIGADCWIGASAVIMANVGEQSTIGAGSVVVKDIPAGMVAVGVPAKPIKSSVNAFSGLG